MDLPFAICHWPLAIARSARLLRHPSSVIRHCPLATLTLVLCSPALALAQRSTDQRPPPLDPAQAKAEAQILVAELLAPKPDRNSTNAGQVRIRDADGKETETPARFEIVCTPTNWLSIYETLTSPGGPAKQKLAVIHNGDQPNQYLLYEQANSAATNASAQHLSPSQTMIPFAGSDFWLADLGLEFLHWPEQRLLKKEMRHSKSCEVLESTDPHPVPGGYSRVVAWITIESPHGIVHADAYDSQNDLVKLFDPTNLEKINGDYQLAEMEMRNHRTGSHTWIKFDLSGH
jgi:hypothetical protein